MKPLKKSRTAWSGGILGAVGFVQASVLAAPPEMVTPVAAWWLTMICAAVTVALGGTVVALRAQDRRRSRTAADLLIERDTKAAKAAAKIAAGMALLLLASCQPHWELCEVDLSNHPVKPRPAASARVRCSRTVLCDVANGATCDGKALVEATK